MSVFATNTWPELFYGNNSSFTAVANTTSETSLLGGVNLQPTIAPPCFAAVPGASARCLTVKGWGLLGTTTGPPTINFKFYLSTSIGTTVPGTVTIGSTGPITTVASVSNMLWKFELDILCRAPGQGTGNATLFVSGLVTSPGGFASPTIYPITPGGGNSATITAAVDGSIVQYLNVSATWSAANASNTVTLAALPTIAWN